MLSLETVANWAWLIPAFTMLAFVVNVVVVAFGGSGKLAARITVVATALSTIIALVVLAGALGVGGADLAHHPVQHAGRWAPVGETGVVKAGILIDPLSAATACMVTIVCLMIFVYSTGYMKGEYTSYLDPRTGEVDEGTGNARYGRFFAFVALFATGMLGFVLSSNLLEALVFWEVMGLCSYLLIGFWYYKKSASSAAVKAFLTTRVGDMFFLAGVFVLYAIFGTVDYEVLLAEDSILHLRELGVVPVLGVPIATVVAILILGGAIGKSAQFPLHVWLPDAMEGPTPVSALIHAATMVSAGVYLVARMYPVFVAQSIDSLGDISGPMGLVAIIGGFTAIFAGTIGVAQFDIKRVLAYSTISQLGYMFLALGVGAYVAAVFHMINHAFFKGLLFLGSGSIIHGVEHGHEHSEAHPTHEAGDSDSSGESPVRGWAIDVGDPAQDMRNMGGLRLRMPFTFVTFLTGTLALTGIPIFAGFWSKDEILAQAFHEGLSGGSTVALLVWILGTLAAFLTALYMSRQIFMVFAGRPSTEAAQHAPESEPSMVYPLVVLALFALLLGFVGVPEDFPLIGSLLGNPFHHFQGVLPFVGKHLPALAFNPWPAIISVALALGGWAVGWLLYGRSPAAARAHDPLRRLGPLWTVAHRKYYIDEIYSATVIAFTIWFSRLNGLIDQYIVDGLVNLSGTVSEMFSRLTGWIDAYVVDGVVNLTAYLSTEASRGLRLLQSGRVQQYLLIVFFGLLFLVGAIMF